MRKIVLLPEPFGPSRPTISPGSMAKETSVTARRGPYHFETCCANTTGDIKTHKSKCREHSLGENTGKRSRALRPGSSRPLMAVSVEVTSLVEFGRVLVCLEGVGVVRVDNICPFDVADSAHPGIRVEHADGIIDTSDTRQDVLVEVFLQI